MADYGFQGMSPTRARALRRRIKANDPETRAARSSILYRIWSPIGMLHIAAGALYEVGRTIPIVRSGILFPLFILGGIVLYRVGRARLTEEERFILVESRKHDRRERLWVSVASVLFCTPMTLLLATSIGISHAAGAKVEWSTVVMTAMVGAIEVIALWSLARKLYRIGQRQRRMLKHQRQREERGLSSFG